MGMLINMCGNGVGMSRKALNKREVEGARVGERGGSKVKPMESKVMWKKLTDFKGCDKDSFHTKEKHMGATKNFYTRPLPPTIWVDHKSYPSTCNLPIDADSFRPCLPITTHHSPLTTHYIHFNH